MEEKNKNLFQKEPNKEPAKASSDSSTTPTSGSEAAPVSDGTGQASDGGSKVWGYVLAIILIILVILAIIFFASPNKSKTPSPTTQTGQVGGFQDFPRGTVLQSPRILEEIRRLEGMPVCEGNIKEIVSLKPALIMAELTEAKEYTFLIYEIDSEIGLLKKLAISPQIVDANSLDKFSIDNEIKYGYKVKEDLKSGSTFAWTVIVGDSAFAETYRCFRISDDESEITGEDEIDLTAHDGTTLLAQGAGGDWSGWFVGISDKWFSVNPESVSGLVEGIQNDAVTEDIIDRCGAGSGGSILVAVNSEGGAECYDLGTVDGDWRPL